MDVVLSCVPHQPNHIPAVCVSPSHALCSPIRFTHFRPLTYHTSVPPPSLAPSPLPLAHGRHSVHPAEPPLLRSPPAVVPLLRLRVVLRLAHHDVHRPRLLRAQRRLPHRFCFVLFCGLLSYDLRLNEPG